MVGELLDDVGGKVDNEFSGEGVAKWMVRGVWPRALEGLVM